jgi:hypothetical protein
LSKINKLSEIGWFVLKLLTVNVVSVLFFPVVIILYMFFVTASIPRSICLSSEFESIGISFIY